MAKRDNDLEFSVNAAFDDERAVDDKLPLYLMNGSLGAEKRAFWNSYCNKVALRARA